MHILDALARLRLDIGSDDFPPTTLALASVDVGNPAFNVIPGAATARFNVRFNDNWSPDSLERRLRDEIVAAAPDAAAELIVEPGASDCFLTTPGKLTDALKAAIHEVTGETAAPSTGGGTSDARFFKDVCPVVEFGLVGDTMHQTDERVPLDDLHRLTAIYRAFPPPLFQREARMITRDEIERSLTGAWLLFLDKPGAIGTFDASVEGFWRSFQAIVLVAPVYAITIFADHAIYAAAAGAEGAVDHAAFYATRWVSLALDWVTLPLILAGLARFLGIRGGYPAYVVARNWSSVLT